MNQDDGFKKLLCVLHCASVEIRILAIEQGECSFKRIAELADIVEVIPLYLYCGTEKRLANVKHELMRYQKKYGESLYDYMRIFDEDAIPLGYFPISGLDITEGA